MRNEAFTEWAYMQTEERRQVSQLVNTVTETNIKKIRKTQTEL